MITQLFHLADVHIRKGNYLDSRFSEYANVIQNTIETIKNEYIHDESICVICGDVFHHKLQISSHGIVLFYKLVHGIADLMPLIIIQGNHDLIQENDDENNDLIKALLDNHKHNNVHYLDTTGVFEVENIHFGMVSIRDMLNKVSSSGLVDELPIFPLAANDKLNIALSHATIQNCLLHNYTKTTCGIPIEWFKEYDAVLLGDVHLQSVKYNKKHDIYYGYPGSLVQQDFGESLFHHGFLVWNIDKQTNTILSIDKRHVHNTIGRANAKVINNVVYINAQNYVPIDEFLESYENKPKDLHIRLYCKENSVTYRNNIVAMLDQFNIHAHVDIINANVLNNDTDNSIEHINLSSLNSSNIIVEFFKTHGNADILNRNTNWERYFESNHSTLLTEHEVHVSTPENIKELVVNKNTKLNKFIESIPSSFIHKQNTVQIKKIQFDWILSYGKKNVFHFSNDKICLINAPNGFGKSAFFECIVLGLFGESIPSRYNKSTSSSIVNSNKRKNTDNSNIVITFDVNNTEYTIKRQFYEKVHNNEPNRLQTLKVELYEKDVLLKTSSKLVNKWVNEHVCTIQDFLLSTMVTQNFDNDFFKLKIAEQIELLDNVLQMDKVNSFSNLMKESKKEYKDLKNHIDTYTNALKPTTPFNSDEHNMLVTNHQHMIDKLKECKSSYSNMENIDCGRITNVVDDIEKPNESFDEIINQEATIAKHLNILNVNVPDQLYETHDLSIEEFIHDEFVGKPSNKSVSNDKHTSIKTLITILRDSHDKYDYMVYTQKNLESTKPIIESNRTLEEYDEFINKLNKYRKKCKKLDTNIPEEPNVDINDMKHLINEKLIQYTIPQLQELLETSQTKHDDGKEYKYNPSCWACNENFMSNDTIDIQNMIKYKEQEELLNKWQSYQKNKTSIDILHTLETEVTTWEHIVPKLKQYQKWSVEYETVCKKIGALKQNIIDQQFVLEEAFAYQNKCNEAFKLNIELNKLKKKKRYYVNEKIKTKLKLEHYEQKEKDMLVQLTRMNFIKDQEIEFEKNKALLEDLTMFLTNKIELFQHFVDTFKTYKSWIYNEKLLPAIVKRTNTILSHIFTHRVLELRFRFIDNNIIFTVVDENNEIHIEKLSGAQSFAVSLSFRLALSSIGINKFQCNQLFIDEGFCNFDQQNLLNVPILIKNLKNLFNEIILVTHLEEIKSCADCVVNITRNHGISQIVH